MSFAIAAAVGGGLLVGSMMGGQEYDASGQIRSAEGNERIANRQMDINEKQFAESKALQEEFLELTRKNNAADEEVKALQAGLMRDQASRRENVFNPLEDRLVAEAKDYDSAERISSEMGKADSAVIKAYDRAIQAAGKDQLRLGINPNSAKALALRENASIDLASRAAGASTQAAAATKGKGFAMRMDVAGLGRNLATNQTAAAQSALTASQSQNNSFSNVIKTGNDSMSTLNQGFGGASNAFSSAGNLYGSAAEAQYNSDPMNQLMKVGGYAFGQWAGGGFKGL